MLLRLLEFALFFALLVPAGALFLKLLQWQGEMSLLPKVLAGLLFFSALSVSASFFLPLWYLEPVLILAALFLAFWRRSVWPKDWRFYALAMPFLVFATWPSYIPDDGGYYGQTLQIFREFGVIKGIANLNSHLALGSGFHAFHSVWRWPELSVFAALNPFLLFIFTHHLWQKIQQGQHALFYAISFIALPFLLLLSTGPSPDVLVFCTSFWLLEQILLARIKLSISQWFLLLGLGLLIKPTLGLAIFFMVIWVRPEFKLKQLWVLGALAFTILLVRDLFLTGYLLYPLSEHLAFDLPWTVPKELFLQQKYWMEVGFYEERISALGQQQTLLNQLTANPIKAWLYLLVILLNLLLLTGMIIKKEWRPLLFIIGFELFWWQNPGFRLGMHIFIPLLAYSIYQLWAANIKLNWRWLPPVSAVLLLLLAFAPEFTLPGVKNPIYQTVGGFNGYNLWQPEPFREVKVNKVEHGQVIINQPDATEYCWYQSFPCRNWYPDYRKLTIDGKAFELGLLGERPEEGFKTIQQ